SNRGSKRRRAGKEPESTSAPKDKTSKSTGKSAQAEEPIHTEEDLEEPVHQEFDTGFTEDQHIIETTQHPDWFQKLTKPPTLDRDWNKTLHAKHGPVQPWISTLARNEDHCESFNEPMDTLLDFSAFVLNRLKVYTLTPELLAGPTFELMKGQQYPHDLRKLLPLIPNLRGHRVIPFDHFFNNDLAYLSGGVSSRTYATSVTKIKAADYGHIKWIEDLVQTPCGVKIRLQDIEYMMLLLVQGKLTNLNIEERLALGVSLQMFTRSIVIRRCVEDLQLGIKSYQKKLNLTKSDTYRSDLKRKIPYTSYSNPKGFIYQNKARKNRLMRIEELHKFSDGTLNDVRSAFDDILKRIRMEYLPQTVWRNVDRERVGVMIQAIDRQLRNIRLMRSLEKFIGGRLYGGNLWLLERTI
ncbi:hypothetical protein Tco_0927699, partial [Tanacetum coccineum]